MSCNTRRPALDRGTFRGGLAVSAGDISRHTHPPPTQLQLRGGAALILSKDDSQKPVGELGGPPTSSGYDEAAPLDEGAGWRLIGTRRTSW